jgi:hypothetical protein
MPWPRDIQFAGERDRSARAVAQGFPLSEASPTKIGSDEFLIDAMGALRIFYLLTGMNLRAHRYER